MKRITKQDLLEFLVCVECGANVEESGTGLCCNRCGREFGLCGDRPVLMRRDNALFPMEAYLSAGGGRAVAKKRGMKARLKGLIPGKSVNVARERMLAVISAGHDRPQTRILVIGCGNQHDQLARHFSVGSIFVFCDVDKGADADIFCDSHDLPFADGSFDGVISTAVLEHVTHPDRVIDEVHRVLVAGGFLYSEIPFLQGVHEGAYDFTRFTLSGHRRLCEKFSEIEAGMVAGPGTALVWALVAFFAALPPNRRLSQLFGISAQFAFFWLKYADFLIKRDNKSLDAASCTYFYGSRSEKAVSADQIIARYGASGFTHT